MPPARPRAADPSTRPLSEVARHVVVPAGVVDTIWFELEAQCLEWGIEFDTWQDGLGQLMFGLRSDGTYAATVGGVTLSIPRQVAKTFIVSRALFALCVLFPGTTVIWTAHRTRTATQTFQKLQGFTRRKAVAPYVAAVRAANGEQEIGFRNGSRILFGAREQGFGRGFDEVDVIVFDEAQILTERALEDMVASTNQSRHPHGALLFYMGTPPRPVDPGEAFTHRRSAALAAKDDDTVYAESGDALYVECSADPAVGQPGGPGLDDEEQVAKANPSFPHRTPRSSIARLRANLTSDPAWRREALGVWDGSSLRSAIDWDTWNALHIDPQAAPVDGTVCVAVKFSADGERVGAAVAVKPPEGPTHVVALGVQAATAGATQLARWLVDRWRKAAVILVDGRAGADDLIGELRSAGVPQRRVRPVATPEAVAAHAGMARAIADGDLTHGAQEGLDAAVRVAGKRVIGNLGGWGWQSITPEGDVTALDAVTLARFGATAGARITNRRSGASNGRKAVVM